MLGLAGVALLAFSGCERGPLPPPQGVPGLTVVVRPGPATWFSAPNGRVSGFDHDLLTRFARERGVPLNVTFADSAGALLARVGTGAAQLGAGGLFQAASARPDDVGPVEQPLAWSTGYHAVEPVLIYNVDGYRPRRWSDLERATVAYPAHTGLDAPLAAIRLAHPEVRWQPVDKTIDEDLKYLQGVTDGELSVLSRTTDDTKWTVAYVKDNGPVRYYVYDRPARTARFLFTNRPAIESAKLSPMHLRGPPANGKTTGRNSSVKKRRITAPRARPARVRTSACRLPARSMSVLPTRAPMPSCRRIRSWRAIMTGSPPPYMRYATGSSITG